AEAELLSMLGSLLELDTEAVLPTEPLPMHVFTRTTIVMVAGAPAASVVAVQETVPVPPTAGVEQFHPAGAVTDWNVVWAGVGSTSCTPVAEAGPLFVTVTVYVMFCPVATDPGAPDFVTDTSELPE